MTRDPLRSPRSPRRLVRLRSSHARFLNYALVLGLIAGLVSGLLPLPTGPAIETASANHSGIKLPVPGGEAWRVSQGYNTSPAEGGSHYNCDPSTLRDQPSQTRSCSQYWQYKYSFDLVAVEGTTAGRTVVSPVNGIIRWIDEAYGGMSIDLGDGYAYAFFHASLASTLRAGQTISQGQYLGTVASAGNGGNGGFPHLHVTIWQTNDGGNWSRIAVPFAGAQAIEGVSFGASADSVRNQHRGAVITSSNAIGPASEQPPAPPLLASPPHGTTYRVNSHIATLGWEASSGATDYQVVINDGAIVSPWVTGTSWTTGTLGTGQYAWQVRARNAAGQSALSPKWVFWVDPANPGGEPTPDATPGQLSVSLTTAAGAPGLSTTASGGGMNANETVDIFWDSATGTKLGTATANSAGNWSASVQIPDATGGAHKVVAKGSTSGKTADATFTVSSALLRIPYQGPPGTSIAITVKGFGANETVSLTFMHGGGSNVSLGSTTTNANGTGTLTATMPESTSGWHDYQGRGQTSGRTAWGALYVQPIVSLSSSQGNSGASVTATAKGFPGGQAIRFAWNQSGSSSGTTLCSSTSTATGSATCSFTVPEAAAGSYPVVVTANDGTTASANFGVAGAAALTLTPASGGVGTQFQLSVGGFQANETVRFTIDGSTTVWQEAVVGSTGTVLVKSTIPVLTQGAHTIAVRGVTSGRTASASLTVNPTMEINPSGGAAGSSATVYVRGMKASQSIAIRFNATSATTGTSVCSGTTNGSGSYTCSFSVPSIGAGSTYPVLAVSGGLSATKNFAVTSSGVITGGAVIGIGTYQVTATQEGLVGGTTSNGHVIVPDDHFVALPACTPSNCPWLTGGSTSPTLGYITNCGSNCFVRVTNPATGICRVEPIWDTGPWFTNDNWWEPTERRNLNNLSTTVNVLPQGYAGVDAARDGLNVGYGVSQRGIGISNVGYEVGNRAAIDIADGTWKDIGFADGAGPRTVVVSMLWQTGEDPTAARQACLGEDPPGGGDPVGNPSITIAPTGGKVGAQVTVTGSGYGSGERVDIFWDSTHSGTPLQSIVANSSGSFSIVITVPQDDLGRHLIVGKGAASGLKPSRSFTILPETSILIDPLSGSSGAQVNVSGQGFVPGETVSIHWDSTGSTGTRLASATADSNGAISTTITIPSGTVGDHYIVGSGDSSGAKASRTFNLTATTLPATEPRISINPTSGQVGSTVVVTGTGYGDGEQVEIYWDTTQSGTPLATVTASASGQFTTSVTVPDDTLGRHLIAGKGLVSGLKPSRSFTILPRTSVLLTPSTGPAGTSVTVTGQGFTPNEQVDVFWDSTGSTGTKLTTVSADGGGAFSTTVTVPVGSEGGHYIVGRGVTSGLKASRTFTLTGGATPVVDARITIDKTTGPGGTQVVVTGSGYEPNEVVDIMWDSSFTGLNLGNVTANGSGAFTITITVPDASDGRHLIIGKGRSSGEKPSRSFTVSSTVVVDPRILITPTEGRTATSVSVSGSGYAPNERVDIYWDSTGSTGTLLGTVNANSSGTFTTTVTVPHDTGGRHLIVGKGATSGEKPSRSFYIAPSVSAGATNVSVGASVNLTLRGYQSGETIGIYWDEASGTPLATVTANATGSASASITIPQTVNGAHQVVATSGITAGATAALNVSGGSTAAATASFDIASASPGMRVTLNVANFWSTERVEIYWDDRTSPTSTLQTGFTGGGSGQLTIPAMPGGTHTVTVKGVSSGKSATATITFTPVLILTPPIGETGARIVADVKAWTPGVSVTIYFNRPQGGTGGTAVCTATGRDSGTASCSFNVPSGFAVGAEVPVTAVGSAGSSTTTLRITNTPVGFASVEEATAEATPAATATPDEASPDATGTPEPTENAEETPSPEATDTPNAEPTDEPVETPTEAATEDATEEVTEEPVEVATEAPTEEPVEVATEAPTEAPTEVVTEVPTQDPTPEPTVVPEPRFVTVFAAGDVTVYGSKPDEQPGEELAGALGAGGPDGAVAYITFSIEGIGAGAVTNAQLVLTGAGSAGNGGTVGVLPGYWVDEASAVYATVPTSGWGPAVDIYGSPVYLPVMGTGQETRLDVTGVIVGDGVITFVVTGDPASIASFTSRESGVAPRLEITVQD